MVAVDSSEKAITAATGKQRRFMTDLRVAMTRL
jgi:hypothetical protein